LTRLDPVSLSFALHRLPEIPEPLLRQQTWSTLFEQVRGASLRPTEYLAAVRRFAPLEHDGALVGAILERAGEVLRRFLPIDVAQSEAHALLGVALSVLPETSDDLRLVWLRSAVAVANEAADLGQLIDLADGSWTLDGVSIDQELRWQLAIKAAAHGLEGAAERLDGELQRDPSDRGQRAFIRAQASVPDAAAKAETWRRIHEEGYGSDYLTRAAIDGFQWRHQRDLLLPFREPCFAQLEHVYATRDHAFASSYARGLVPDRWAEASVLERLHVLRAGLTPEQVLLARHVDEIADDLARDIRVRAFGALTT
jgi:aminopeptidase N